MLVIATQREENRSNSHLMDAMHRLRARAFSNRLGWNVTVRNGLESDEFDALQPTYIIAVSIAGAPIGCARLLPATGPTMLERVFPQLLPSGGLAAHAGMVESSRFCVDTALSERGENGGFAHEATLTMIAGIIEWAMANGLTEIVTATDLRIERILARVGWPMQRLATPRRIGNTMAVAGALAVDETCFARVCPSGYRSAISFGRR